MILVVWNEERYCQICITLRYLPESEGRIPETGRIVTTTKNPRIEMGRNWNGFLGYLVPKMDMTRFGS
jgi:hypothetical protein